jgi:hypothetical protein
MTAPRRGGRGAPIASRPTDANRLVIGRSLAVNVSGGWKERDQGSIRPLEGIYYVGKSRKTADQSYAGICPAPSDPVRAV